MDNNNAPPPVIGSGALLLADFPDARADFERTGKRKLIHPCIAAMGIANSSCLSIFGFRNGDEVKMTTLSKVYAEFVVVPGTVKINMVFICIYYVAISFMSLVCFARN